MDRIYLYFVHGVLIDLSFMKVYLPLRGEISRFRRYHEKRKLCETLPIFSQACICKLVCWTFHFEERSRKYVEVELFLFRAIIWQNL